MRACMFLSILTIGTIQGMSLEFLSAYASHSLSLVSTHALVCVHHSVHVAGDLIVEVLV